MRALPKTHPTGSCTLTACCLLPPCAACRYFDKTGTGYLRVEDLRRILHNLGHSLPHRAIKALAQGVADPHGGWRGERVYYRWGLFQTPRQP